MTNTTATNSDPRPSTYAPKEERQAWETRRMARFSRLFTLKKETEFVNDRPILNPDGAEVSGPYDHVMNTGHTYAQERAAGLA